jgi:2'-5' RNA ligase
MTANDKSRLFLALWPDDITRAALAQCRNAWIWDDGARPEPDERLHLTLHFLGAVSHQGLPELVDGLRLPSIRFALELERPQRWPNGVAVLQPSAAPYGLLEVHAALSDRLDRLGLSVERRQFRPHVTLARNVGASTKPPSNPFACTGQ